MFSGTGPLCLAHPGGPGFGWEYLRMPALEQHLTMVYLEPIGTGDSGRLPARRDYRLDVWARFLHGVAEHLGAPKVLVLGHSHGGFVAQRYALEHPDTLAGLILYATAPVLDADFWAAAMSNLQLFPQQHPDQPEASGMFGAYQATLAAQDDDAITHGLRRIMPVYFADYWAHEDQPCSGASRPARVGRPPARGGAGAVRCAEAAQLDRHSGAGPDGRARLPLRTALGERAA